MILNCYINELKAALQFFSHSWIGKAQEEKAKSIKKNKIK